MKYANNWRFTIWQNDDLDWADWVDAFDDEDVNTWSEEEKYERMVDLNQAYLDDEREQLNVNIGTPILVLGDIGRWNGRVKGYKEIKSGNIADCLYSDCDYVEWYVDENGEFMCHGSHHDGDNLYTYRKYKEIADEDDIEELKDKLYNGTATQEDIDKVTEPLGDIVCKQYGITPPKKNKN